MANAEDNREQANRKTLKVCLLVTALMFGFAFALVPLYNVFCSVTGINGKIDISRPTYLGGEQAIGAVDDRVITVEFVVTQNEEMPWSFKPQHTTMKVRPGEIAKTGYFAHNPTKRTMTAQAIPSISPGRVSKYFKKVECFCFSSQTLSPGETENLALQYYLDPNIPKGIHRLTLSYTLFDVTNEPNVTNNAHG